MLKILYMGRLLVVLLLLSILTACVSISHPSYPEGWGTRPSIADNVCTDIAGDFRDRGSLVRFFWSDFNQIQWTASGLGRTNHLKIEQGTDVIKISAWELNTKIAQIELKKQNDLGAFDRRGYLCTNEGIAARGVGPSVHQLAGFIAQKLTLFKVSDGSLIVKNEETGGGLALVIPAFGSTTVWHRYDAKEVGSICSNADLGHADAQLLIADNYYLGTYGQKADAVRAWVWYSLAAQGGDAQATELLTRLTTELTREQLAEAKRQLAVWKTGQCMQELVPNDKGQ